MQNELQKSERLRIDAEKAKLEWEAKYKVAQVHLKAGHGMLVDSSQLLEILEADTDDVLQDLEYTAKQGYCLDRSTQGRSRLLMQTPRFQAWFSSSQNGALLVDGREDFQMEKTSAMSVVCALIAQSLPSTTAKSLVFFCGLHLSEQATTGPVDMLRSLLSQLINHYDLNAAFMEGRDYEAVRNFDLQHLCVLMTELVRKLPRQAVLFCLIDGISWYETEEMAKDACTVVQMLNHLVHESTTGAVFKLLITSPTTCRHVQKSMRLEDRLVLRSDVAEYDGNPLSPRQLMTQLEQAGSDLEAADYGDDFDEGYGEG